MKYAYMRYYDDGRFRDEYLGVWKFFGFDNKNVIMEVG